jgi:hypothetical protein
VRDEQGSGIKGARGPCSSLFQAVHGTFAIASRGFGGWGLRVFACGDLSFEGEILAQALELREGNLVLAVQFPGV